jgi:RNA polymerase subunit RPABC4/transcription elongation factor Spt4
LILERVGCSCKCPETVFEARGPRCPVCNHEVKIELTDRWEDPFLWIDPDTHGAVRVDEVKSS